MKTEDTNDTSTAARPKLKIKTLKLTRETVENLSERDAGAIKGGSSAGGSGSTEGGAASLIVKCWVARAVYGEENPRWRLFRDWLLADAPVWFRDLYARHGERFARWIAPHPTAKAVIRWWMDTRIEHRSIASTQPA